jgi:DnaJ-domain-containing protein 1
MDSFALLGVPRQIWIDADALKERFLAVSSAIHPDKAESTEAKVRAEEDFAALNTAYNTLRSTRGRILHLLELAGAPRPEHVQNVPESAAALFPLVAEATRAADALLKEKSGASSPMLKVQFLSRALPCAESLQRLQAQLRAKIGDIEDNLKEKSVSEPGVPLSQEAARELQEIAATLGFLERWSSQLQERALALSF